MSKRKLDFGQAEYIPTVNPVAQPKHPPFPEKGNWVLLGYGRSFMVPYKENTFQGLNCEPWQEKTFWLSDVWEGCEQNQLYAAPVDSLVVKINAEMLFKKGWITLELYRKLKS